MKNGVSSIFRLQTLYFSLQASFFSRRSSKPLIICFTKSFSSNQNKSFESQKMLRTELVKKLETLFPNNLAEKWDNTGLLIAAAPTTISGILLCNDLTMDVFHEAMKRDVNFIISYHPPIFKPFKKLSGETWKEELVLTCISNDISVYSHHTACDAVRNGVNDWFIRCFDLVDVKPIQVQPTDCVVECLIPHDLDLTSTFSDAPDILFMKERTSANEHIHVKILAKTTPSNVILKKLKAHPKVTIVNVSNFIRNDHENNVGAGRIGKLSKPLKLKDCVQIVKKYLKLDHVRVSVGRKADLEITDITTIASCAGSGASLVQDIRPDLYVTGEMSHHDVLDAQQRGVSVILVEHSNSERGHLVELAKHLESEIIGIQVMVSKVDKDPICIV